jgi:DNA-binding transcriptional MerR regulator
MDTQPIEEIARKLDISVETIRSYAQRFALFVPAVRTRTDVRYPPEGATLLAEIADAVQAGVSFDEIESALQTHIPVTVVASPDPAVEEPPAATPVEEFLKLLSDQQRSLAEQVAGFGDAIERLATADEFHGLRAETASLAAALAQRDSHLVHTNAVIVSELREAFGALRGQIADLHAQLRLDRLQEATAAGTDALDLPAPEPVPDQTPTRAGGPPPRKNGGRTPRRMGQPLRLNGSVQN